MSNTLRRVGVGVASLGSMLLGLSVFAAVDPDVASTTESLTTTLKDNIVGVISTNIANLAIAGVIIIGVFLVWRLAKRFISGR